MKEYILELFTKTKNLHKFFIYLSKQEDPQELCTLADKQITRTFASNFTRDKNTAEIIDSKKYKEFISNGKNSLISIFEQKKYGRSWKKKE